MKCTILLLEEQHAIQDPRILCNKMTKYPGIALHCLHFVDGWTDRWTDVRTDTSYIILSFMHGLLLPKMDFSCSLEQINKHLDGGWTDSSQQRKGLLY